MGHAVVQSNEGQQLDVFGDGYRLLATGGQTEGTLAAVEVTVSPLNGAPPHVNNREAIGWYVIEGSLRFLTESGEFDLDAGGWFYSPKGTMHTFRNATDEPVKALMLAVPSGMDAFFTEVGRELNGSAPPPPQPNDVAKVMETAPRYGFDVLPPPE